MNESQIPRLKSLDGLRGIAALVVLFGHIAFMSPLLSDVYEMRRLPEQGSAAWWMSATPLHAVWAGPEAVYVFFVLSGAVLTLSALKSGYDWFSYFPKRLLRLYVPVWAAIGFAALAMALVPRTPDASTSAWLARRASSYDAEHLRMDITLLFGGGDHSLSTLWSLRWEVWFSLLLPLFVLFAAMLPRWWFAKCALIVVLMAVGVYKLWPEAQYLAMFAAGSLIAAHWESLRRGMTRILRVPGAGLVILALTLIAFTSRWWTYGATGSSEHQHWWSLVVVAAAVSAVLLAAHWTPAVRFLSWRPVHWLGTISFSLYLVHETVIISVRYLLPEASLSLIALIGVAASLVIAWVFYLAIERPATRLARVSGKAASRVLTSRETAIRESEDLGPQYRRGRAQID